MIFSHDGDFGDIIYSLPYCRSQSEKFVFNLTSKKLSPAMLIAINPLLASQPYIEKVTVDGSFDRNLSLFRNLPINLASNSISHWYYLLANEVIQAPVLSEPWLLNIEPNKRFADRIVVFRSPRYRRNSMTYKCLSKFRDQIIFLGIPAEYEDFSRRAFPVEYAKTSDFLETAKIIKAAKLVIGNQTGLFSLAEALKVDRILEMSFECPNVVMSGGRFNYAVSDDHLNKIVDKY